MHFTNLVKANKITTVNAFPHPENPYSHFARVIPLAADTSTNSQGGKQ
jgi:hypothetical protein